MVEQAVHFSTLAPNIQVKFPCTAAGLQAVEDATARGVVANVTVVFTVAQCIAAAEAVERGLRRVRGGRRRHQPVQPRLLADDRTPGRLDEGPRREGQRRPGPGRRQLGGHRRVQAGLRHLPGARLPHPPAGGGVPPPAPLDGARGRGRRPHDALRLAGPVQRFGHRPRQTRIDVPVDPHIIDDLPAPDPGLRSSLRAGWHSSPAEFEGFGATARTLRGFVASYHDLQGVVRDIILPNPDLKSA